MKIETISNLINRVDSAVGSHNQEKQEDLLLRLRDFLEWHVIPLCQEKEDAL